jgi:hypothetical protein
LIALIINAHPSGTEIDSECLSILSMPVSFARYRASRYLSAGTATTAETDTDVKTRFSSRSTQQQAV